MNNSHSPKQNMVNVSDDYKCFSALSFMIGNENFEITDCTCKTFKLRIKHYYLPVPLKLPVLSEQAYFWSPGCT